MFNKGAMFGLDARIALAIFGALSVISGAALYSAIQNAKVTAVITELNEVGKAYDSYYLDTGSESSVIHSNVYLDVKELSTSAKAGWAGPYLSYEVLSGNPHALVHPVYDSISVAEMLDGAWTGNGASGTWESTTRCDTGTVGGSCAIWVVISGIQDEIYKAMEVSVDGSTDGQKGNIRLVTWSGLSNVVFYKYRPKQN